MNKCVRCGKNLRRDPEPDEYVVYIYQVIENRVCASPIPLEMADLSTQEYICDRCCHEI